MDSTEYTEGKVMHDDWEKSYIPLTSKKLRIEKYKEEKMEEQNKMKIGIGNLDQEKQVLKPAKLRIVGVSIENIEKAKADKVIFSVKHPDKEEPIKISSVSYLDGREVVTSGTWLSFDKEGKIQKNSSLAILLGRIGAINLESCIGKDIDSELIGKYLCFKAY